MKEEFKKELQELINKHSIENMVDMPDFLIADLMCDHLEVLSIAHKKRDKWFNKSYWDKQLLEEKVQL